MQAREVVACHRHHGVTAAQTVDPRPSPASTGRTSGRLAGEHMAGMRERRRGSSSSAVALRVRERG